MKNPGNASAFPGIPTEYMETATSFCRWRFPVPGVRARRGRLKHGERAPEGAGFRGAPLMNCRALPPKGYAPGRVAPITAPMITET